MIEKLKNNLTVISSIMIVYFTICGTLWHIGYWSTFDINILQYITVGEIIKSFIIPFLSSGIIFLITYFTINYVTIADNINKTDKYFSGKGKDTRVGRYLNKNKYFFLTCYFVLLFFIYLFASHPKWLFLPLLLAIPIGIILSHQQLFINIIPHPDLRYFVLTLFVYLPLLSFGLSKYNGLNVRDNIKYKMISKIETSSKTNLDSLIGFKYLGSAGNKIFLSKLDNSEIVLLNDNLIDYIGLKPKD